MTWEAQHPLAFFWREGCFVAPVGVEKNIPTHQKTTLYLCTNKNIFVCATLLSDFRKKSGLKYRLIEKINNLQAKI